LTSFTEEMRRSGLDPGSRVLERKTICATPEIAAKLALPPGSELFLLRRLRLAGGEPMGLQTVHIACGGVQGLLDHDFERVSLYETLDRNYGLAPHHAWQKHYAIAVNAEEAGLLRVPEGAPALGGERLTFLRGGQPLELTYSIMRGDRYQIELKLVRAPEGTQWLAEGQVGSLPNPE
jgi:GntR family transcriptional regulator